MARRDLRIGFALFLLLLFNAMPAVPLTGGEMVLQEPTGTRGTIVVNASGGGDYTRIQWAIDNASEGDTVYVEGGVYYENVVVGKTINLTGASQDNTIINGGGVYFGIKIRTSWANVSGFKIINTSNNYYGGIYLENARSCTVENITCQNNYCGINIYWYSRDNIIKNTLCIDNHIGISVQPLTDLEDYVRNIVINNICFNNTYNYDLSYNIPDTLSDFHGNYANGEPVKYLESAHHQVITEPASMVILINCNNITVQNISAHNNSFGIYCAGGSDNQITHNVVNNNSYSGIYIEGTNRNLVRNNVCSQNMYGYGIVSRNYDTSNTITSNICESNDNDGIRIDGVQTYIQNNTCNYNGDNGISMGSSSKNNFLKNNTCISNVENGIYMYSSWNNYIINNTCSSNKESGISLGYNSGNNRFENNFFSQNNESGINLYYNVDDNVFLNNSLIENSVGMNCSRECRENNISYNIFQRNSDLGLWIYDEGNTVTYNTFDSNNNYGLYLYNGRWHTPRNNLIHHNNFINNNHGGIQAKDDGRDNSWNILTGGNYWSDLNNIDNNDDGIVDFPYTLDGRAEAEDHLPLTKPVGIPPLKVDAGLDMVVGQYETVSFKGSVNCHEYIINYTWSFEYNETQHVLYGQSPSFTFSIPGIYVISFLVEDCFSRTYHDTLNVTVIVKLIPEADAGIDIYIDQHQTANFDASLSVVNEGIVNYSWNFYYRDAEIVLYGITSQYSFHAAGIFQVTLKVTDAEGNWDTDTLNVTVRDITPPIANAGLDITINQSDTVEFFFHQNSTDNVGIENWNWTFIYDGTKQTLFHSIIMSSLPFFTFDIPGNYTVTMNVSDEAGNWAIDTLNVTVLDNIVPVSDIWGEHTIEVNTTFQFNSSSCWDNVAIVNWTWKFEYGGERVFLYGPDPSFRFEIPGKYQVQLIVFDAERNAESSLMTITVEPGRTTPGDDDLEPADNGDKGEEKDRGIMAWIWLGLAVFLLSAVVVLLVFLIRSKKGGEEPAEEDEMGRVGKNEGVEDEG